jgi:hypothetical protein
LTWQQLSVCCNCKYSIDASLEDSGLSPHNPEDVDLPLNVVPPAQHKQDQKCGQNKPRLPLDVALDIVRAEVAQEQALRAREERYRNVYAVAVPVALDVSKLPGRYYQGDGLGYNVYLSIRKDGTFDCTWRGCLGVYGTSKGSWSLRGNRVVLHSSEETGMMKGHLSSLDVLLHDGELILVRSDHNDFFLERGPSRYSCFTREP